MEKQFNSKYSKVFSLQLNLSSICTLKKNQIQQLVSDKKFEEAIANCNQFIKEISFMFSQNNSDGTFELQDSLKNLVKLNQGNYEAYFSCIFQGISIENIIHSISSYFFNAILDQLRVYIIGKDYYLAISISFGFKSFINKLLNNSMVATNSTSLLNPILVKTDITIEAIYFDWLENDDKSFVFYHCTSNDFKLSLTKQFDLINDKISEKNYEKAIDLQSNFIKDMVKILAQAHEPSKALNQAWLNFLVLQRQKSAFTWVVNDCLNFYRQDKYLKLLQDDLLFLSQINYLSDKKTFEIKIKTYIMNLLFKPKFHRNELNMLRQNFCSGFDAFNLIESKSNIALSLLGMAIINAYEVRKEDMLDGFKLAIEYDVNLEPLIRIISYQLSSYMEQLPFYIQDELINPFIKVQSIKNDLKFMLRY